jgi:hypothetical protein
MPCMPRSSSHTQKISSASHSIHLTSFISSPLSQPCWDSRRTPDRRSTPGYKGSATARAHDYGERDERHPRKDHPERPTPKAPAEGSHQGNEWKAIGRRGDRGGSNEAMCQGGYPHCRRTSGGVVPYEKYYNVLLHAGACPVSVLGPYRGETDIVPEGVLEAYKRGAIPMYLDLVITHLIH